MLSLFAPSTHFATITLPVRCLSVLLLMTVGMLFVGQPGSGLAATDAPPQGLTGTYYKGRFLAGAPFLQRIDSQVNFQWGAGSFIPTGPTNDFSVRWQGTVTLPATGATTFFALTDDGVRLWLNNTLVINNWIDRSAADSTAIYTGTAGEIVSIRLEYYERGGNASAVLSWSNPSLTKQVIPVSALSPLNWSRSQNFNDVTDVTRVRGMVSAAGHHHHDEVCLCDDSIGRTQ